MIKTIDDLIEVFGGVDAIAETFGVGRTAVANWRASGRLPARLHLRVVMMAEKRGYTVSSKILTH